MLGLSDALDWVGPANGRKQCDAGRRGVHALDCKELQVCAGDFGCAGSGHGIRQFASKPCALWHRSHTLLNT